MECSNQFLGYMYLDGKRKTIAKYYCFKSQLRVLLRPSAVQCTIIKLLDLCSCQNEFVANIWWVAEHESAQDQVSFHKRDCSEIFLLTITETSYPGQFKVHVG